MNKDKDKKGINLMPESLRSRESGVLSKAKIKDDFDFDFVSPEGSSLKKSSQKLGPSFWTKIKKSFFKPKGFGESIVKINKKKKDTNTGERPKIIYNPNEKKKRHEDKKESLHIPAPIKQDNKQTTNFAIDYKNSILNDTKKQKYSFWDKLFGSKINKESKVERTLIQDIAAKQQKEIPQLSQLNKDKINGRSKENHLGYKIKSKPEAIIKKEVAKSVKVAKKHGPSFWDKFKNLFNKKVEISKLPKIERVPAKPIISKDIKETKSIDILDKKNLVTIPEIPIKDTKKETKELILENQKIKKPPIADFSIPAIADLNNGIDSVKKVEDIKKSKKSKFHQPQSRIRAKLLDNGGGVDLIPVSAKTRSWRQVINLLLMACLGAGIIIGIFYGFLFYQGKNIEVQKNNRADQITSLERKIVSYKDLNNDITQLGDEIKSIHSLLGFHFYWTNFFQLLEKYTVEGVYYSGLSAGNGGALTLHVMTSDFDTLARQIKVLEQDEASEFVVSVDVSSATYNEASDDVSFDMTIVLNPALFVYNENYMYEINNGLVDEEGVGNDEE